MSALSALVVTLIAIISLIFVEIRNECIWYESLGPNPETKSVIIPPTSMRALTRVLQDNQILSSGAITRERFLIAAWMTSSEGPARAGELTFPDHASPEQVLLTLRHGSLKKHKITIPEGMTAKNIEKMLNDNPLLSGELSHIHEGTVFPSTYSYLVRERRQSIVVQMKKEMSTKVARIWSERDVRSLGKLIQSPAELVTLASLIERESTLPKERTLIAGVFLKRLQIGMRLQTDPSVLYALSLMGRDEKTLSHQDMSINSPYNTYLYEGLPPGPICSPGEGALYAAAHPSNRGFLYFVANKKGGHEFSRSYAEHQNRIHRIFHSKSSTVSNIK